MELAEAIRRRRMVRRYRSDPVPVALLEAVLAAALRGPSAGFSQGFGFLALDRPADVAAFRAAATPAEDAGNWFCANFEAPAVVLALSNKAAYLDRYAQPDKGRPTAPTPGGRRPTGTSTPASVCC